MEAKHLLAFIIGGLAFLALQPLLVASSIFMIIGFLVLILAVFILPGGWFLGYLGVRSSLDLLRGRIGRTIILCVLAALGLTIFSKTLGNLTPAIAFALGGLIGLQFVATPPSRHRGARPEPKRASRRVETYLELGRSGIFSKGGLSLEEARSGVLVMGLRAGSTTRKLVKELAEKGFRVLIIGSRKLIPETSKNSKLYVVEAVDLAEDLINSPEAVEAFTYAFNLANRLRNDDIPLLLRSCRLARENLLSGKLDKSAALQSIAEGVQDPRRAPVILASSSNMASIRRGGFQAFRAELADVTAIEVHGSERDRAFITAYLILAFRNLDACLVIQDPEILVRDVNLLPYDARESWEYVFNVLADWRSKGLILVSKSPILSSWAYLLCQARIYTRLGEYVLRPDDRLREILPELRSLGQDEAMIVGEASRKVQIEYVPPIKVPEERWPKPVAEAEAKAEEPSERGGIVLEEVFGGRAVDAARILEKCRKELRAVAPEEEEVLKKLVERGYVVVFGGRYLLTATGEEVLKQYQESVKAGRPIEPVEGREEVKPAERREEAKPVGEGVEESKPVQSVVDAEEMAERMDEHSARLLKAESLFRQGKYGPCVMTCYKFMVNIIKAAYGIEKGRLTDLVEKLGEERAGLTLEEAKEAFTIMIEARDLMEEGRPVPLKLALRMLTYSRKVMDRLYGLVSGGGGG